MLKLNSQSPHSLSQMAWVHRAFTAYMDCTPLIYRLVRFGQVAVLPVSTGAGVVAEGNVHADGAVTVPLTTFVATLHPLDQPRLLFHTS